ncbi:MAG: hypothetical protein JWR40_3196 [Massilia sp.]|nr:hypothetical protein [Massilia sp.]MDB5950227.1 hypothetical protein [Massilia sp.]
MFIRILTRQLCAALMLSIASAASLAGQATPASLVPTPYKPTMDNIELAKTLLQQEQLLQFATFGNDTALELGLRIVAAAKRDGKAISVAITRNGQLLFQHAMPGTASDNAEWIRRKNNVVDRFGHSSYYVGLGFRNRGLDFEKLSYVDNRELAAEAGAFPLLIKDVGMVGTITVSGLPQAQDHTLLVAVLQDYLKVNLEAAAK